MRLRPGAVLRRVVRGVGRAGGPAVTVMSLVLDPVGTAVETLLDLSRRSARPPGVRRRVEVDRWGNARYPEEEAGGGEPAQDRGR